MSCPIAAQKPVTPPPDRPIPQQSSAGKPSQYVITVKGCVNNRRLTLSASDASNLPFEMLRASEFTLDGPRELLRQIREEHNGHYDEIEGIVSVPPTRRAVVPSVESKKLGPVSVGVGSRESIGVDSAPRDLTLKVKSLTHLNEGCVERR